MSHEYPIDTPPEIEAPVVVRTGWMHSHPYLVTTIGAIACIVLVALVVSGRSGVSRIESGTNWVGAGSIFFMGGQNRPEERRMTAEEILRLRSPEAPLPVPLPPTAITPPEENFGNDLTKLLAQLTQGTKTSAPPTENTIASPFSFIPQGLISINSGTKPRTEIQDSLFNYGNEIGTYIQGFESMHGNSPQIFKDHVEDRNNKEKAAAVGLIGDDYTFLGRDLLEMQTVPKVAEAMHIAYATAFRVLGTDLVALSKTTTDDDFLKAIETYNKSVEGLAKRYLALVALFGAHNVTFSSSDQGNIFMFNPTFSF